MASRRANPTAIGAFALGAIALAVAAALILGSGRFLHEPDIWVAYFDSSVVGLDKGAPVLFRGVRIGRVTDIQVYIDPVEDRFATPVFMDLNQGGAALDIDADVPIDTRETIERWISEGLRARLQSQSIVTGKLYVEIVFHPHDPIEMKGIYPGIPEIPTVPTPLEELGERLSNAMKRLEEMPLEEALENLNGTLASAKDLLGSEDLKSAVANLDAALSETRTLVQRINRGYGRVEGNVDATLDEARVALEQLNAAIEDVRGLIRPGSPMHYEFQTAMEELALMARSVRVLSDSINRDPNQIIFGKKRSGGTQ